MTCLVCGHKMTMGCENVKYDVVGLLNVTLVDIEVSRCPNCGEHEYAIPDIEGLHRALAYAVTRKHGRLTPEEVRFLRKYLGWSGADFARHIGATPETVSRWENGTASMGGIAERLLRLMVLTQRPVKDYSLDLLAQVSSERSSRPVKIRASLSQPRKQSRKKAPSPEWTTTVAA